jgi:serine/threonine protein kinase
MRFSNFLSLTLYFLCDQNHRGTLNYVAPEIINRVPYDETVDIWSLGVIVFVLLQGYLPFELTEKFSTNKYELHFDPVDFRHISLQAKTLISRCLDISPHKRPSAKDLLLAPWLQESTHEGRQESRVPLNSPKKLASVVANNSSPKIFLGATELFPANHTEPSET